MLGDDVVIADAQVAEVSFQCLQKLGVQISTKKSLISDTGAFDFAKRFCVKGGRADLSAMSACSLLAYHHPYGLIDGYMSKIYYTYEGSLPS